MVIIIIIIIIMIIKLVCLKTILIRYNGEMDWCIMKGGWDGKRKFVKVCR